METSVACGCLAARPKVPCARVLAYAAYKLHARSVCNVQHRCSCSMRLLALYKCYSFIFIFTFIRCRTSATRKTPNRPTPSCISIIVRSLRIRAPLMCSPGDRTEHRRRHPTSLVQFARPLSVRRPSEPVPPASRGKHRGRG